MLLASPWGHRRGVIDVVVSTFVDNAQIAQFTK